MNPRTVVVLVLALVCGTSAALGVGLLGSGMKSRPAPVQTVDVVVAAVDLPRGTTLHKEAMTTKPWPANLLPTGSVTNVDEIVGSVTLGAICIDEPILKSKIGESGTGASSLVKPGWRAYTIHTPTVSSGVAGFVLPGNHVDVLLTVSKGAQTASGGGVTTTLLQNVEILAADRRLAEDEQALEAISTLQSVTLQVTPEMAAKLSLAQSVGSLHLSLRNDGDNTIAQAYPVTVRELEFDQNAFQSAENATDTDSDPTITVKPTIVNSQPDYLLIRTFRGTGSGMIHVSND